MLAAENHLVILVDDIENPMMKPEPQPLRLGLPPQHLYSATVPKYQGFIFSSMAPMMAACFTNPFDVARVRVQLQGELAKGEAGALKVYNGPIDCVTKIFRHEGIAGLEKGLSTALMREGSKNIFRLGLYDPIIAQLHSKEDGPAPIYKRLIAGAISGSFGAISCNPFEIIKTRMQAQANSAIATGHQHNYRGVFDGFRGIIATEGVSGLYKGSATSVLRSAIGTGVNMAVYTWMRDYITNKGWLKDGFTLDVSASFMSSLATALMTNPVDVVRTRLYNQPVGADGKGLRYKSGIDAAIRIFQKEGPAAFLKGFVSSFMRLGPHFVLTFVFLEQLRRLSARYRSDKVRNQQMRIVFNHFDQNRDGRIDMHEIRAAFLQAFPRPRCEIDLITEEQYQEMIERQIISLVDKTHSSNRESLTFEDFLEASKDFQQIMRLEHQRATFDVIDVNKDGLLSYEELTTALKIIAPYELQEREMTRDQYEKTLDLDIQKMIYAAKRGSLSSPSATGMKKFKQGAFSITFEEFVHMIEGVEDLQLGRALDAWMRNAGIGAH